MLFSDRDIRQIRQLGIKPQEVEAQLERFKTGFPEIKLSNIVDENQGVIKLSSDEVDMFLNKYDKKKAGKKLVKFVPASGAASRMFKILFNYLEGEIDSDHSDIQQFHDHIKKFAFYDELKKEFDDTDLSSFPVGKNDKRIVEKLISKDGLNFGNLPKALLPFHAYDGGVVRKAIDEHLAEGAQYSADLQNNVSLHFTVSQEHMELIDTHLKSMIPTFERKFGKKFIVSFSIQDPATNTLAVDLENNPLRQENGELIFRPGGHGALLKNLNEIDADVIFIKNIDNVVAGYLLNDTIQYKKALGGILIETQDKVFEYCVTLNKNELLDTELESEIVAFLEANVGLKVPSDFQYWEHSEKKKYVLEKLNRPIRICGVVKSSNTGGGPFWVSEDDGSESLQLVETDQINKQDDAQLHILESAKYANITDLVCGVRNFRNEKFELPKYMDADTGFITKKSIGGQELKAMELPGLWNGSMSAWNTMFVEVPMTTFNPVKTVLDLLKPEHQGFDHMK